MIDDNEDPSDFKLFLGASTPELLYKSHLSKLQIKMNYSKEKKI